MSGDKTQQSQDAELAAFSETDALRELASIVEFPGHDLSIALARIRSVFAALTRTTPSAASPEADVERIEPDHLRIYNIARTRMMNDVTGTDFDEHLVRVAFAEGRKATLAALASKPPLDQGERAAIVAWMKDRADRRRLYNPDRLAEAIERGEHLEALSVSSTTNPQPTEPNQ